MFKIARLSQVNYFLYQVINLCMCNLTNFPSTPNSLQSSWCFFQGAVCRRGSTVYWRKNAKYLNQISLLTTLHRATYFSVCSILVKPRKIFKVQMHMYVRIKYFNMTSFHMSILPTKLWNNGSVCCVVYNKYSSPSILQPSVLRPPVIIRPLDLVPRAIFCVKWPLFKDHLQYKTTFSWSHGWS